MAFTMPHITVLVATGAIGLALLFQIIGLATEGWITGSQKFGALVLTAKWGLWSTEGDVQDWLDACRAFSILGMLAMAGSLASALLIFVMSDKKIFSLLAPLAAAGGAFCSLIEFAVFAGEMSSSSDYFGYSFGLTVAACVLSGGAAVLFFLGYTRAQ